MAAAASILGRDPFSQTSHSMEDLLLNRKVHVNVSWLSAAEAAKSQNRRENRPETSVFMELNSDFA
jgi:hypothetical protein